jgi:hypothetical protein
MSCQAVSQPAMMHGGYLLACCELKFLGKHQAEFIGAMNAQQVTRFGRLAVSAVACLISVSQWRIALHSLSFSSSLIVDSTHTLLFNTQNTCPTLRMMTMICFSQSFARTNRQDKRRATHGEQKRRAWSRRPKNLPPLITITPNLFVWRKFSKKARNF